MDVKSDDSPPTPNSNACSSGPTPVTQPPSNPRQGHELSSREDGINLLRTTGPIIDSPEIIEDDLTGNRVAADSESDTSSPSMREEAEETTFTGENEQALSWQSEPKLAKRIEKINLKEKAVFSDASTSKPFLPQYLEQEQQQQQQRSLGKNLRNSTVIASVSIFLLVKFFLVWSYYNAKRQKEWQKSSSRELEKIRQRTSGFGKFSREDVSNIRNDRNGANEIESASLSNNSVLSKGSDFSNELAGSDSGPCHSESKQKADKTQRADNGIISTANNGTSSKADNIVGEEKYGANPETIRKDPNHDVSKIRARQQEQLETNNKSIQRKRRQEARERKRLLHNSLKHDEANEASIRRKNVTSSEEFILKQAVTTIAQLQQQPQPQGIHQQEEIERVSLLQQQNLEYLQSLQQDQERDRLMKMQRKQKSRRRKAVKEAQNRLVSAKVRLSGNLDTSIQKTKNYGDGDENSVGVQIRLILPSGTRIKATFRTHHPMGLVYDLAIISLDEEKLLWDQEEEHGKNMNAYTDLESRENFEFDLQNDAEENKTGRVMSENRPVDYMSFHNEWEELFHRFKIVNTFPRQEFDALNLTLEQFGFSHSASLMVIVEID